MISVVIPTLDEAKILAFLLDRLTREPASHEIIVVAGVSRDGTIAIAADAGARVMQMPPGRGRQLAAGARSATGDILFFLHADSKFPQGGLAEIARAMAETRVVGGNFRLVFDGNDGFSRWLNGFYATIRKRGFYYGDSGVFVRRSVYDSLGGIRPIALMEDYDFVRRMESTGATVCIEEPPLVTSARRFEGRRPLAIVSGWLVIHALFHLGVSPEWLAKLYDSPRRRTRHA